VSKLAALKSQHTSEFISCDFATLKGVEVVANTLSEKFPVIDTLIIGQGTLTLKNERTADDIALVSAVNALSKYNLCQRLLPCLKRSSDPRVLFLVAGVPLSTKVPLGTEAFPLYRPTWPGFLAMRGPLQMSIFHYVKMMATKEPSVRMALADVGLTSTGILRDMPYLIQFVVSALSIFIAIPVSKAAHNFTWLATTTDTWQSGLYLPNPGNTKISTSLEVLDQADGEKIISAMKMVCGV